MLFLDNASTTRISQKALDTYVYESENCFYNPSALYMAGANISQRIKKTKKNIIRLLNGSKFDNLIFTSGATESNNMVLRSFIKPKFTALIGISEHPSVYNVAKQLLDQGFDIEFVNITKQGIIDLDDFKSKLNKNVNFVSIMHVNNETGAINPIKDLVKLAKNANPSIIFHSDGVQAFGKIEVDVEDLGVDLYTLSSHKIYGPKGIGALYIRKGINIKPLILGGGQEQDLRSGTENTPAIFAFEKACEEASEKLQNNTISYINDYASKSLQNLNLDIKINSCEEVSSKYIISFSVLKLRAETILRMMEQRDILIGNGSACSSHKSGNRILSNMGVSNDHIEGALRISFNYDTTINDIDNFISELKNVINEYKDKTNR